MLIFKKKKKIDQFYIYCQIPQDRKKLRMELFVCYELLP